MFKWSQAGLIGIILLLFLNPPPGLWVLRSYKAIPWQFAFGKRCKLPGRFAPLGSDVREVEYNSWFAKVSPANQPPTATRTFSSVGTDNQGINYSEYLNNLTILSVQASTTNKTMSEQEAITLAQKLMHKPYGQVVMDDRNDKCIDKAFIQYYSSGQWALFSYTNPSDKQIAVIQVGWCELPPPKLKPSGITYGGSYE